MTYARTIIDKAKTDLIEHIRYEIHLIDTAVNLTEQDSTTEEDWPYSPTIDVETDNTYLDVEDYTSERRKVVKVSYYESKDILVETYEGDEIFGTHLSVDELASISDCLDFSYKKLCGK